MSQAPIYDILTHIIFGPLNGDFTGAGAGGAGATITPIGFLVLGKISHSFIKVDGKEEDEKWVNVMQTVARFFSKRKKD